jgi:hypothetical protein
MQIQDDSTGQPDDATTGLFAGEIQEMLSAPPRPAALQPISEDQARIEARVMFTLWLKHKIEDSEFDVGFGVEVACSAGETTVPFINRKDFTDIPRDKELCARCPMRIQCLLISDPIDAMTLSRGHTPNEVFGGWRADDRAVIVSRYTNMKQRYVSSEMHPAESSQYETLALRLRSTVSA